MKFGNEAVVVGRYSTVQPLRQRTGSHTLPFAEMGARLLLSSTPQFSQEKALFLNRAARRTGKKYWHKNYIPSETNLYCNRLWGHC